MQFQCSQLEFKRNKENGEKNPKIDDAKQNPLSQRRCE